MGGDAAPVQQDDVVGDGGRLVEVVQHHADGDAVVGREVADQVEEFHLVAQVEVGGGLVEQQHRGVLGQAGCEPCALHLSAREGADVVPAELGQSGQRERAVDGCSAVGVGATPASTVRVASQFRHLAHGHAGERGPALREHRQRPGQLAGAEGAQRLVTDGHLPGAEGQQGGQPAQQRRLATAVRSDQGGHLTASQPDVHPMEDRIAAVPDPES